MEEKPKILENLTQKEANEAKSPLFLPPRLLENRGLCEIFDKEDQIVDDKNQKDADFDEQTMM